MEPTLDQIIKAYANATASQLDAVSEIDALQDQNSPEHALFMAFNLDISDIEIVGSNLKYALLGLLSIHDAITAMLAQTSSEEESLLAFFSNTIHNFPSDLKNQIVSFELNKNLKRELPGFEEMFIESKKQNTNPTVDLLSSLAKQNIGDSLDIEQNPTNTITKSDILSGIEHPSETVKSPSFALPKSKPQTTAILSSLVTAANPTKAISIDIRPDPIDPEKELEHIVDPFIHMQGNNTSPQITPAHTPQNTTVDILAEASRIQPPNTPAQALVHTMDAKLNTIQRSVPSETYKVIEVPRHDPYREVPGI